MRGRVASAASRQLRRARVGTRFFAPALGALLALVLSSCGSAATTRSATARAQSLAAPPPVHPRFFAATSIWNAPLAAGVPAASDSGRLVGLLRSMVSEEVAAKVGPWLSTTGFSTPIYTVPADQPTVYVHLDAAEPALQSAFAAVPLPAAARPASGTDSQLTVWQPSRDRMWEFWRLRRDQDGWRAGWGGAMSHVSQNPGVFGAGAWPKANSRWGATATSLPLVGGLITLEDLKRERIDHALALGLPRLARSTVVAPAKRTDGTAPASVGVPAGTRFRLDPSLDLRGLSLPPLVLMIAEAAQRYGVIVRDTSTVVDFYGEDPTPTGADPYDAFFGSEYPWQELAKFPWDRLEVVMAGAG